MREELVAVYDETGRVTGSTTRADVRARGLWHATGEVLLRSGDGESVYVHRRSADKDVFPGLWDCWAGGVVAAGETPEECAFRELAEELGVRGVALTPLFTHVFEQPPLRCHNFCYEARWDGPVVHQPEEIVEGRWLPLGELREWARDPGSPLIPDGRAGILEWFRRYP
ncbi:8-oxo-dGTP pyrophosphatase MutT (NUDIX family) [Amycolatopsis bartoniae]|uniref:NUDIX hydrolase n=1 Tax=Amycolatopsis bartoniae TaxID=941986 RepID=A0A8H9MDE7_9PSEU|nr:NUDIX domain-containing protein [Amycolatopsis bartoniae]MBB2936997.1 8-oxo-dGTP pyrophosphatase MutT (NUDIX family) [Amycolatopsis bartoniae]GHF51720.1 NUDIX hydrolase [Amycolatopsis bartoniae]